MVANDKMFVLVCGLMLALAYTFMPDVAFADLDTLKQRLCEIVLEFSAPPGQVTAGRALALLAVMFLGFGAMFGKVNWTLAVTVIIAIVLMTTALPLIAMIVSSMGDSITADGICVMPAVPDPNTP